MNQYNDFYNVLQKSILSQQPLIESYLQSPPKGSIADRVAIYTDGYFARLEETLLSDFQTLATFLGEEKFRVLSKTYITTYPSSSFTLNVLGQHLRQFLTETSPYDKSPYLAEIAAYEWAESQAFFAADAPLLTVDDLQSLPPSQWPELKFHLHPSCYLLPMQWNSFLLIKAVRAKYKHLPRLKKLAFPQSMLVWRHALQIRYNPLDQYDLVIINAIQNNESFLQICELLSQLIKDEAVPGFLVKKLYMLLHEKILVHEPTVGS